jgi:hypothetical protein
MIIFSTSNIRGTPMKRLTGTIAIFLLSMTLCAGETFFIVTDETFEGNPVPLGDQAREGILDSLFETGHIVLDDPDASLPDDILSEQSARGLLDRAAAFDMPFLVIVRVSSKKTDPAKAGELITAVAGFAIYDVFAKKLVGRGELRADNNGKNKFETHAKFWFYLGGEIAIKIGSIYDEYMKK